MLIPTKALKIAVTGTALVCALGGLMFTTLAEGTEYYLHVDEVMENRNAWADKPPDRRATGVPTADWRSQGDRGLHH